MGELILIPIDSAKKTGTDERIVDCVANKLSSSVVKKSFQQIVREEYRSKRKLSYGKRHR